VLLALAGSVLLAGSSIGAGLGATATAQVGKNPPPLPLPAPPPGRKDSVPPNFDPCPFPGAPWGWAGKVRPGRAFAARRLLGSELLAEVHDPHLGTLDLTFGTRAGPKGRSTVFSGWKRVLAQSARPELHSCGWMLDDKPAAKRLADSADAAVRARRLYIPPAKVHLVEEFVSDDFYDPGTVIVTIRVDTGRSQDRFHDGGPPEEIEEAFTAIVDRATAKASSVTRGGL
jgi:hypothetical protein